MHRRLRLERCVVQKLPQGAFLGRREYVRVGLQIVQVVVPVSGFVRVAVHQMTSQAGETGLSLDRGTLHFSEERSGEEQSRVVTGTAPP